MSLENFKERSASLWKKDQFYRALYFTEKIDNFSVYFTVYRVN